MHRDTPAGIALKSEVRRVTQDQMVSKFGATLKTQHKPHMLNVINNITQDKVYRLTTDLFDEGFQLSSSKTLPPPMKLTQSYPVFPQHSKNNETPSENRRVKKLKIKVQSTQRIQFNLR